MYPTHGLGPVCQAMNIHRGDKLNYLVTMDTKAIGNRILKKNRNEEVKVFSQWRSCHHYDWNREWGNRY